jgi:hypothetical protein
MIRKFKFSGALIWGGLTLLALAFFSVPCQAGKACEWAEGGWFLRCRANWFSTGCIGLKNVAGTEVKFLVNGDGDSNKKRSLGKNKQRNADFKGGMDIHTCKVKKGGKWTKIYCYDAFDRQRNNKSGGGCGCAFFKCL